jgi:hypothetical protein
MAAMLKLIAWTVVAYALSQLWAGLRAWRRERPGGSACATRSEGTGIDRSQIVDAEFTDMDGGREKAR